MVPVSIIFFKPASNTCGGILLAWRRDIWSVVSPSTRSYSLTAHVTLIQKNETWWTTSVYGPQLDHEKTEFLDELRTLHSLCSGHGLYVAISI